ncbi:hypothetical protein A2U01_0093491, partial [Trifolium medium]|nr:hypothetical protein [Trifolium medium]
KSTSGFKISGGEGYVSPRWFEREEVRMDGDILEVDCSRFGDVVQSGMNWSNKS